MTDFSSINMCSYDWCQGHGDPVTPTMGDGWSVDIDGTHTRSHHVYGRFIDLEVWETWHSLDGRHTVEGPTLDPLQSWQLTTSAEREAFAVEFARLRALAERIEAAS